MALPESPTVVFMLLVGILFLVLRSSASKRVLVEKSNVAAVAGRRRKMACDVKSTTEVGWKGDTPPCFASLRLVLRYPMRSEINGHVCRG